MQRRYGTDTITMADNHGLMEMRGAASWMGDSMSTGWLSEPAMNARNAAHVIKKIEIGSMWYLNIWWVCSGYCLVKRKDIKRNRESTKGYSNTALIFSKILLWLGCRAVYVKLKQRSPRSLSVYLPLGQFYRRTSERSLYDNVILTKVRQN